MLNDLIIIGAGGFGKDAAWLAERINAAAPTWNILGFLDDTPEKQGTIVGTYPVLGKCERYVDYPNAKFVCAIGSAAGRKSVVEKMAGAKFATLIDPSVIMSNRVEIGEGAMVCAGNIITMDIRIGRHAIIIFDCTIGHDTVMGDYVTLYPSVNVSGNSNIGDCCEIGTGAQIIQKRTIGPNTIIGAGAVVTKDIPANCIAVGCPAKPIKFHG